MGGQGKGKGTKQQGWTNEDWYAQTWPQHGNDAWGKGKGGKQSKGKMYEDEDAGEGEGGAGERTTRIWSRFQIAKAILRASVDERGSCFVKDKETKRMKDDTFLSKDNFTKMVNAETSHLVRRPGVGISEASASIRALFDVLANMPIASITQLHSISSETQEINEALTKLSNLTETLGADEYADAFLKLQEFVINNSEKIELATIQGMIATGRQYLGFTALRQLLCLLKKPKFWAESIPESLSTNRVFKKWKQDPKNKENMAKAMAALILEKKQKNEEHEDNSASGLFASKPRAKPGNNSSASSDESKETKGKKKKKKRGGKKSSKKSSASSSSSSKQNRKENKKRNKQQDEGEHSSEGEAKHPKTKKTDTAEQEKTNKASEEREEEEEDTETR